MSKKVHFSLDAKNHDGSSYMTEKCYKIINSFFNTSSIYHKKIGKTQEEIDEMLAKNLTINPTYQIKQFVKSKKTGECDILLPIGSADDCINAVDGDMSVIYACIENLTRALENIKEKRIEKFKKNLEKVEYRELEMDNEWDKSCTSDVCYNRRCCYDKKMKTKLKDNVAIIRAGGRDCNCVAPVEYGVWIEKLLGILKESVEKNDDAALGYDPLVLNKEIMA